jgi:hypothetical protein
MSLRRLLAKHLSELDQDFPSGHLAYLALTGKVENLLRDKLAIRLHCDPLNSEFRVAREWKHRDIAILNDGAPVALIEFKASYSFDAVLHPNDPWFVKEMKDDIRKASRVSLLATELYLVLFSTHIHSAQFDRHVGIVKYAAQIQKAAKLFENAELLRSASVAKVATALEAAGFPHVATGAIPGGEAWGIGVVVDYWLCVPIVASPSL